MERFSFRASGRNVRLLPIYPSPSRGHVEMGRATLARLRIRMRLRSRLSVDRRRPVSGAAAWIVARQHSGVATVWHELQLSPQDAWYAVEDLWLRLASRLPVHAEIDGAGWRLVVGGLSQAVHGEAADLRVAALAATTYGWQLEGQRGSFVRSIAFEGDDLVLAVTSIPILTRWPQGDDLGWQVKGFFARLRASQEVGQSTARYTAGASRTDTSTFNTAASDSRLSTEMFVTPRSSCDT